MLKTGFSNMFLIMKILKQNLNLLLVLILKEELLHILSYFPWKELCMEKLSYVVLFVEQVLRNLR